MEYLLAQQAAKFAALENAPATSANDDELLEESRRQTRDIEDNMSDYCCRRSLHKRRSHDDEALRPRRGYS
jgi:hypothetical protein